MARHARRGTPQLLFAASLTVFLALAVLATSVSDSSASPAQTSRVGSLCQINGFPSGGGSGANGNRGGARSSIDPGKIAKGLGRFVVERAVGANLERWGVQGLSGLFRLINLGSIAPDSAERRMLGQLRAINSRLGEIEVRIDRVGDRVNRLIGERRRADLNQRISKACNIASGQMALFRTYTRALESGLDLGKIVEGRASASAAERAALEDRVVANINEFISAYGRRYDRYTEQIDQLRRMLVPRPNNLGTIPVLTIFGKVLLSRDRFLHRADSEALRGLYYALSEIRALAALMLAEYWDGRELQTEEERALDEFLTDTRESVQKLPKMIPPGVVIDLGSDRDSTNRMPMWFAPTKKDLGWFPRQSVGGKALALEEVDDALKKLDARKAYGKGWSAPGREDLKALITTGCRVDPDHPARLLQGCRNAVPAGSNIAAYLQRINEDETWQMLFCQRSVNPKCPPKAGPVAVRRAPHPMIWTADTHSQRLICGRRNFPGSLRTEQIALRFTTHAGFHTLAADYRFHEVFPHLPMRTPYTGINTGLHAVSELHERCNRFIRELVLGGGPGARSRPDPLFFGVLLANRFSGPQDVNPKSRWDYMAQPFSGRDR